jgi:hypothetical protein
MGLGRVKTLWEKRERLVISANRVGRAVLLILAAFEFRVTPGWPTCGVERNGGRRSTLFGVSAML